MPILHLPPPHVKLAELVGSDDSWSAAWRAAFQWPHASGDAALNAALLQDLSARTGLSPRLNHHRVLWSLATTAKCIASGGAR